MDDVNQILQDMANKDPNIAQLFRDVTTTPMTRFPQGFRWHYYDTGKTPRFRRQFMCYSVTKNENGKFLSWVYDWQGKHGTPVSMVEHCRRKDAKKRASKLYEQRRAQIQYATSNEQE